jgi:hypothetical protein
MICLSPAGSMLGMSELERTTNARGGPEATCNCCGRRFSDILAIDGLSDEAERNVREVIRNQGPISGIKALRELTGIGLAEGKRWVDHCGELFYPKVETIPCPYCTQPLRTSLARQCRHCLRDWHDPKSVTFLDADRQ